MHTGERECVGGYVYLCTHICTFAFFCAAHVRLLNCPAYITGRWTRPKIGHLIFQAKRMSSDLKNAHDSGTSLFGSSASWPSAPHVPMLFHSPLAQSCTVSFLRYTTAPGCSCKVTIQKLSQKDNIDL